jgi:hypothetical protein
VFYKEIGIDLSLDNTNNKITIFIFRYNYHLYLMINDLEKVKITVGKDKYGIVFHKEKIETQRLGKACIKYVYFKKLNNSELMLFTPDDAIRHSIMEVFKKEFPGYVVELTPGYDAQVLGII